MPNKEQLHWSNISMYTKCGEQFRRRYREREKIRPGIDAVAGTGMHKAAEINLTKKIETGYFAEKEEVLEAARDCVAEVFEKEEVFIDEDNRDKPISSIRDKVIDVSVSCAEMHYMHLAPLTHPLHVEKKWFLEVDNFPFDLAGTIDCDDGYCFWDWKTSKNMPSPSEADISGQMTMYSLALFAGKDSSGKIIPEARMGYVVKGKTPKALVLKSQRTKEDFRPFIIALERVAEGIEKNVYPFASSMSPRPWWCSPKWCGYYNTCEGVSNKVSIYTGDSIYV